MRYRNFGSTDLLVSELGLGCQSLGGGLYHRDDRESMRTLAAAVSSGITFFDVSDHHSLGATETLLGHAFKGLRHELVLTSKAGYDYAPLTRLALKMRGVLRPVSRMLKPAKRSLHKLRLAQGRYRYGADYLTAAVEGSLRRLQTDYLDLFQLYKPTADELREGAFYDTLERLRQAGKIRHYGIACLTIEDAFIAIGHEGNSSVQVAVNFLEQERVEELLGRTTAKGIAVIARHPRAIGLLTNDHDDLMGDSSAYDAHYGQRHRMARELRSLIRSDRSLAQAAIQYVRSMEGITVTLPRAVNRAELAENIASLTAPPLTDIELEKVRAVTRADHHPVAAYRPVRAAT